MPIKIPDTLPAKKTLNDENIFIMTEERAMSQDIRPLKIAILNLMPTKIETETQLLRLLGNSPLQVDIELIKTSTYEPKNTSAEHLFMHYKTFDEVRHLKFDGLIITGAPVESIDFEEVVYWKELCQIMEWSLHNVTSTFHICWGAQAGLYYHYGINKVMLKDKLSGVFPHTLTRKTKMLVRGFDDEFYAPHSRWSGLDESAVASCPELEIISSSPEAGVYIVASENGKQFFVSGHSEYDDVTLAKEYFRDLEKGLNPNIPKNYFPGNDTTKAPIVRWRSHANLLYSNWLNYYVYQITPYDIMQVS